MTLRDRASAEAMVAKHTANFKGACYPSLLPTSELQRRLRAGEEIVLVDVRSPEEQSVSMLPGAVSREKFEAEILPSLACRSAAGGSVAESAPAATAAAASDTLVVPYCTVGYRSGMYCRELADQHGLRNVRNGEGVIMWTFEGGGFVRPPQKASSSTSRPAWLCGGGGQTPGACRKADVGGARNGAASATFGKPRVSDVDEERVHTMSDEDYSACVAVPGSQVVREVHVFGKAWDCAAEGYTTVYFSNRQGVLTFLREKLKTRCVRSSALWVWALAPLYFFFTPVCGLMYSCGCRLALSKWGMVEPCNVFDSRPGARKCPWCACSGLACIFVGSDTRAFRGVFLLDVLPDGFTVTVIFILVVWRMWKSVDRIATAKRLSERSAVGIKAGLSTAWFWLYCLVFGAIFFAADADYPTFLGWTRSPSPVQFAAAAVGQQVPGRFFVNVSTAWARRGEWIALDARDRGMASAGIIPGAALVPWQAVSEGGPAAAGRKSILRSPPEVLSILAALGVQADDPRPIVVYGAWDAGWGEEGRLFWTLEYLGFDASMLYCLGGGIEAWRLAGYPIEVLNATTPDASAIDPDDAVLGAGPTSLRPQRRATTELVESLVARGGSVLLDVRDRAEYDGVRAGDPYGAARSGHIPGAVFWPWRQQLFDSAGGASGPVRLRSCDDIKARLPPEAATGEVVAYCTGGIRSGFVYLALRGCGIARPRNYDGSWWAWAASSALPCVGAGPGCISEAEAAAAAPAPVSPGAPAATGGGSGAW